MNPDGALNGLPHWPAEGQVTKLYGREDAIRLVGTFLDRLDEDGGIPRSRELPVFPFVGDAGAGKTALLDEVVREVDQRTPLARVSCRTSTLSTTREVLSALAFELNRECAYGRLPFPRLIVGLLVCEATLDGPDPAAKRRQVEALLERHRNLDAMRAFLVNVAPDALALLGVPAAQAVGQYLPDALLRGLKSTLLGRRLVLGEGQAWYGHRDVGARNQPTDGLVDLNTDARSPDEQRRAQADQVLWAAFVADLCAAYATTRRHREWAWNCVLLVDDSDTSIGSALLTGLVSTRKDRANNLLDPDPLVVVATRRGPWGLDAGQHAGSAGEERWWYPVSLPDLSEDEVLTMVKALGPRKPLHKTVAASVYRFTNGHAGSARVLLDAFRERTGSATDLSAVLHGPAPSTVRRTGAAHPDQSVHTTEQILLECFLHGLPAPVVNDLVTCSAARHSGEIDRLQTARLLVSTPAQMKEVRSTRWWPDGGGDQPRRMRPVLRRLLLRRLAERVAGRDPATWGETHAALRIEWGNADEEVGHLYHALAMGEVQWVATQLADLLCRRNDKDWLENVLIPVTCAPSRLDLHNHPAAQATALTREIPQDGLVGAMARLTAALWVAAHPLRFGDQAPLHAELAAAYGGCADGDRRPALGREARRHEAISHTSPY